MATGRQQGTQVPGQPGVAPAQDQGIPAQATYQAPADGQQDGQQLAGPEHNGMAHRLARGPFAGFIPWILFWVIGGPSTWETAAIAALLAAVLLTVLSIETSSAPAMARTGPRPGGLGGLLDLRRLKVLDVATIIFFAALVIVALVTSRQDVATLDQYSQALSSGALGLIALGSVVVGHPFTIDYAKEQAPPEVWHTAVFKKINLVLSLVWTAVFLICAGLGLASVHVHTKGWQDWLNWYIPIALIVIGIRLNTWYPNYVRARMRQSPRS
jgi:hypothetical protein